MSVMAPLQQQYDAWHAQLGVETAADAPWHQMIRAALDPVRDLHGKRLLEIGCGRGGFACWLAGTFPNITELIAADFSPTAVQLAESHATDQGLRRIHWRVEDIQAISLPDASVDTIFSCETIEHVPDPPGAVAELGRVLRPGGRLFLTTPNYLNAVGLGRIYYWLRGRPFREEGQPLNQLTLLPWTCQWVRRAGLRPVLVRSRTHILPWPRVSGGIQLPMLERIPYPFRWLGMNSFVLAVKR